MNDKNEENYSLKQIDARNFSEDFIDYRGRIREIISGLSFDSCINLINFKNVLFRMIYFGPKEAIELENYFFLAELKDTITKEDIINFNKDVLDFFNDKELFLSILKWDSSENRIAPPFLFMMLVSDNVDNDAILYLKSMNKGMFNFAIYNISKDILYFEEPKLSSNINKWNKYLNKYLKVFDDARPERYNKIKMKNKVRNIIGIVVGIVLFIPFVLIAYTIAYFITAPAFGTVPGIGVIGVLIISALLSVKVYEIISGNVILG